MQDGWKSQVLALALTMGALVGAYQLALAHPDQVRSAFAVVGFVPEKGPFALPR